MLDDLKPLFSDTVTVSTVTGRNVYGEEIFGPATPYPARVTYRAREFRTVTGDYAIARGEVWIAADIALALSDRVTLPDGTAPRILTVERQSDETGAGHTKVIFG